MEGTNRDELEEVDTTVDLGFDEDARARLVGEIVAEIVSGLGVDTAMMPGNYVTFGRDGRGRGNLPRRMRARIATSARVGFADDHAGTLSSASISPDPRKVSSATGVPASLERTLATNTRSELLSASEPMRSIRTSRLTSDPREAAKVCKIVNSAGVK